MNKISQEYSEELVAAKRKLDETLGDNFKQYLQTMRQWFTQQLTKYEFDARVRQFLSTESLAAHNRFLLALFNKCSAIADIEECSTLSQTSTSTVTEEQIKPKIETKPDIKPKTVIKPLKKKLKTLKKVNFERRFDTCPVTDKLYLRPMKMLDDCQKLSKVSYCSRDSVLPDHFMSHLRIFVVCWETGLDGVQDNAVKLVNAALRDFIKTILTEVFSSRSSYRLRENRFKYCIGGPPINPYLKNSYSLLRSSEQSSSVINPEDGESQILRPTADEATTSAMYWMACGDQSINRVAQNDEPTNLRHLLYALKSNHNLMPSYSLRCNASYKTVCKLAELEGSSHND